MERKIQDALVIAVDHLFVLVLSYRLEYGNSFKKNEKNLCSNGLMKVDHNVLSKCTWNIKHVVVLKDIIATIHFKEFDKRVGIVVIECFIKKGFWSL